jgi:hypothetical protein
MILVLLPGVGAALEGRGDLLNGLCDDEPTGELPQEFWEFDPGLRLDGRRCFGRCCIAILPISNVKDA